MAYHMRHMSHINDAYGWRIGLALRVGIGLALMTLRTTYDAAYHLLLTSLIWRSNAGCCLWFRNWTNETLKTRFVYHINYALGLTTGFYLCICELNLDVDILSLIVGPSISLPLFELFPLLPIFSIALNFFWHKTIFLILSLSSRKNEPIKVTQSFSIDRWRVDSKKESGYELNWWPLRRGPWKVQDSTIKIERPSYGSLLRKSLH